MEKQKTQEVIIPALNIQTMTIKLIGDSPLICHAWSDKAKRMMLDKQMKKATPGGREAKNPVEDFATSLYWLTDGPKEYTEDAVSEAMKGARFGFPSVAVKACAISGGFQGGMMKKTFGRAAFHIDSEFIEIDGIPTPREDMVRVGMGTADIRYRGEFKEWSALVAVKYNASVISKEQIVSLFNAGGFGIGIGEWRPEKDGSYGMFHVE